MARTLVMMDLVFVYGALRKGASNDWRMEGSEWLGAGSVEGVLVRVDWYPGVVLGGGAQVKGEVYRVGPELLQRLDEFEGIGVKDERDGEYERVRVEVAMEDSSSRECWIYEWQLGIGDYEVVTNGDWLTVKLD